MYTMQKKRKKKEKKRRSVTRTGTACLTLLLGTCILLHFTVSLTLLLQLHVRYVRSPIYIYIYSTIIQHLCRFCWSACFLNSVHVRAIVTRGKLCCTTLFQSESKNTHCETGRKEDLLREAKSTSAVRNKNRDTGDASARPMQPSPIRNR